MSEDLTQPIIAEPRKSPILPVILTVLLAILVSVSGFLAYQNYQLQKKIAKNTTSFALPASTPTKAPVETPDPTADWEIYTNSKYNYTIKYPKDWTAKSVEPGPPDLPLNNTSRGFVLYPSKFRSSAQAQSSVSLMIEGPENVVYPTYEKWINDVTKNVYFKITNIEEKQFSGRSAKVVYGEYDGYGFPAKIQSIYFSSEDKERYFNISAIDDKSNAELLIINQILSTFKFTD